MSDKLEVESQLFDASSMVGYAYDAYCAGWKAAINAINMKQIGYAHAYHWLKDNPPKQTPEPQWADNRPSVLDSSK